MDSFAIAQLLANQDTANPVKLRYGTVTARNADGTLSVIPDGQTTPIKVVRCCWPPVNGRCLILINGTEWLAIAAIGEEDAPVAIDSVWITRSSSTPSTRWPGTTWEKIENKVILGSGTRAVDATGGAETHTLTVAEMPNHSHRWAQGYTNAGGLAQYATLGPIQTTYDLNTTAVGGGGAHNNMPPFRVFHQWLRLS